MIHYEKLTRKSLTFCLFYLSLTGSLFLDKIIDFLVNLCFFKGALQDLITLVYNTDINSILFDPGEDTPCNPDTTNISDIIMKNIFKALSKHLNEFAPILASSMTEIPEKIPEQNTQIFRKLHRLFTCEDDWTEDFESIVLHFIIINEEKNVDKSQQYLSQSEQDSIEVIKQNLVPVMHIFKRYEARLSDILKMILLFEGKLSESAFYEFYVFIEYFLLKEHGKIKYMQETGIVCSSGSQNSSTKKKSENRNEDFKCGKNSHRKENSKDFECTKKYLSELLHEFYGTMNPSIQFLVDFISIFLQKVPENLLRHFSCLLPPENNTGNEFISFGEYTEMIFAFIFSKIIKSCKKEKLASENEALLLWKYGYFDVLGEISIDVSENIVSAHTVNSNNYPCYFSFKSRTHFLKLLLENLLVQFSEPIEIHFYAIQTILQEIDIEILDIGFRPLVSTYQQTSFTISEYSNHKDSIFDAIVSKHAENDRIVHLFRLFEQNVKYKSFFTLYCMKFYGEEIIASDDDFVCAYFYVIDRYESHCRKNRELGDFYSSKAESLEIKEESQVNLYQKIYNKTLAIACGKEMWYAVIKIIIDVLDYFEINLELDGEAEIVNLQKFPSFSKNDLLTLIDILKNAFFHTKEYYYLEMLKKYSFNTTSIVLDFQIKDFSPAQKFSLNVEEIDDFLSEINYGKESENKIIEDSEIKNSENTNVLNNLAPLFVNDIYSKENHFKLNLIDDICKIKKEIFEEATRKRRLTNNKNVFDLHWKILSKKYFPRTIDSEIFKDQLIIDSLNFNYFSGDEKNTKKRSLIKKMLVEEDWRGLFYYGKSENDDFYMKKYISNPEFKIDGHGDKNRIYANSLQEEDFPGRKAGEIEENSKTKISRKLFSSEYYKKSFIETKTKAILFLCLKYNTMICIDEGIDNIECILNSEIDMESYDFITSSLCVLFFCKAKLLEENKKISDACIYYLKSIKSDRYLEEGFLRALHIFTEEKIYDQGTAEKNSPEIENKLLGSIENAFKDAIREIGPKKILPFFLQIITKITHPDENIRRCLVEILNPLIEYNTWFCLYFSYIFIQKESLRSKKTEKKNSIEENFKTLFSDEHLDKLYVLKNFVQILKEIGNDKRKKVEIGDFKQIRTFAIPFPVSVSKTAISTNETIKIVKIVSFTDKITVFNSLQAPKKIQYIDDSGKIRSFLVKSNDDLRKDSRLIGLFNLFNTDLHSDFDLSSNYGREMTKLSDTKNTARQYVVVPFSTKLGIIEWIDHLITLKEIIAHGKNKEVSLNVFKKYRRKITNTEIFQQFERQTEPMLSFWYRDTYRDPFIFFKKKLIYTETLAKMSAIGYFIGLGDRHLENLMIDWDEGSIVHIDLNLLFDKGRSLMIPEKVPFRLTKNLRANLILFKQNGKFKEIFQTTLNYIKSRKCLFEAHLLSFVYDPLNEIKKPMDMIQKLLLKCDCDVENVISQAIDPKNLAGMYVGWMSFL